MGTPAAAPGPRRQRIAVLRPGGLGDTVLALPALESLRHRFPDAEVTLIGGALQAELLLGRSAVEGGPHLVDRHIALTPGAASLLTSGEDDEAATGAAMLIDLASDPFDIGIQIMGGGRHSNGFLTRASARWTVGMRTPDAAPLHRWLPYVHDQPEVFRGIEVMGLLGGQVVSVEPRLHVERAWSRPGLALLHPGAGDPRRRWPAERFGEVAAALHDAGADVAVIGGPGDVELAAAAVVASGRAIANLAGQMTLPELAALLASASVVVGNDSGPVHLARAVGAATVAIYWCGNLINAASVWRARHRPAVSWRLRCPVCGTDCTRGECRHEASFVTDVTLDEVTASALDLFASERAQG